MSVRAYRVNRVLYKEKPTFNLWFDDELVDFIEGRIMAGEVKGLLDVDGVGFIEIPVKVLEQALRRLHLGDEIRKRIRKDVRFAKRKGEGWILYYCF